MNDKVEFIIKHNRFPFGKAEKFSFILITATIIVLAVLAMIFKPALLTFVLAPLLAIGLIAIIYLGLASSMAFQEILTNYDVEKNTKIVNMCLNHLNIKAFTDNEYKNVFVCLIHDKMSNEREEIYIIAKDEKVLINSNKNKDEDESKPSVDFVERIGLSIFITAKELKKRDTSN